MCFTPAISLTTAIIEFLLATIILSLFPKTTFKNFFAIFIYFLGFYQFTEFMLCTTNYSALWAVIGFITYSFLPAIGMHAALKFSKRKFKPIFLYIVPILAGISAIILPNFIQISRCEKYFVTVISIFTNSTNLLYLIPYFIYLMYYASFIIASCIIAYLYSRSVKDKNAKNLIYVLIVGILLMSLPTFILIMLLPQFGMQFPSVLCEFALLLAICAFIGAYLETKI